ncbi:MAG: SUMF1/EgtB/PvdO family nonheme iron enzyme [Deltaproteobacteria bacterium]|nr:SUMF1/EgtB/PvdO family nonheme iron enzyme [Deltaproteobacteria bacterium]
MQTTRQPPGDADGTPEPGKVLADAVDFFAGLEEHSLLDMELKKRASVARAELKHLAGERRLRLAVLGETSAGKSTFINALLGMDLLASDFEPTTAVGTRLTFGPAFQVEVGEGARRRTLYPEELTKRDAIRKLLQQRRSSNSRMLAADGSLEASARGAVTGFIRDATIERGGNNERDDVVIYLPNRYLAAAIDIIDTPGFNPGLSSVDQDRHLAVTRRCVEASHLALFIIDARNPLKATEQRFLAQVKPFLSRIFFVANKMDMLDEEEAADLDGYLRDELARKFDVGANVPSIHVVSSVERGPPVYRENLVTLRDDVASFMQRSRDVIVLERAARTLAAQASSLHTHAVQEAEAARSRLAELQALQILNTTEMRERVLTEALDSYREAAGNFLLDLGREVDRRAAAALKRFSSSVRSSSNKQSLEHIVRTSAEQIYQVDFVQPLHRAAVDGLAGCVATSLTATMASFKGLYAAAKCPQPEMASTDELHYIAAGLFAEKLVTAAPEIETFLEGVGAVIGAIVSFFESLARSQERVVGEYRDLLATAGDSAQSVARDVTSGVNPYFLAWLNAAVDAQLDAYELSVRRLIDEHQASMVLVHKTIAATEQAAGSALRFSESSSRLAESSRASLQHHDRLGPPDLVPLLDQEALADLVRIAPGAVAAGAVALPTKLAKLLSEVTGPAAAGVLRSEALRVATTLNTFLQLQDNPAQVSSGAPCFDVLGLGVLDEWVLNRRAPPFDPRHALLAVMVGEPARVVAVAIERTFGPGSAGHPHPGELERQRITLLETYAYWGVPSLEVDEAAGSLRAAMQQRSFRRRLRNGLAGVAAAASVAVAGFFGLPVLTQAAADALPAPEVAVVSSPAPAVAPPELETPAPATSDVVTTLPEIVRSQPSPIVSAAAAVPTTVEEPTFVAIRAGRSAIGCIASDDPDLACFDDEPPWQMESFAALEVMRSEVTVAEYRRCTTAGRCPAPPRGAGCNYDVRGRGAHPMNCVSWTEARDWCAFVDARLPTPDEWEHAARGSTTTLFPWGDALPDSTTANLCDLNCPPLPRIDEKVLARSKRIQRQIDDRYAGSAPIGSFARGTNSNGLVDLAGNVWEWTDGDWRPGFKERRGGSFIDRPRGLRISNRFGSKPDTRSVHTGFRCVR